MDISLEPGKKVYFASDFHLGTPDYQSSRNREDKIVRWLNSIQEEAQAIFLLGDIFDFWFEYKRAIPKGFVRFQGKLAELSDQGVQIVFFTGNHDMWMFDYFPKEFGIPVYRKPIELHIGNTLFHIGHGDGLGPGDYSYKIIKKIFANRFCQWAFARLHPNFGIGIAQFWSKKSRLNNSFGMDNEDHGEDEWLLSYCRDVENKKHHDYYIFGHRHLLLKKKVTENSLYFNLGEWVFDSQYGVFDGDSFETHRFE
jgi:UDP-2,3-diacylglucosamine hydrolase